MRGWQDNNLIEPLKMGLKLRRDNTKQKASAFAVYDILQSTTLINRVL
jgi:hypothetical protein